MPETPEMSEEWQILHDLNKHNERLREIIPVEDIIGRELRFALESIISAMVHNCRTSWNHDTKDFRSKKGGGS